MLQIDFMITPEETKFLPRSPGCYLFKDADGKVIYVGKANDIKKRVSSYFQKKSHDPKTSLLVASVKSIDFILTKTEAEAFLLENNLIKLHYPKYNIDLKDSRRYAYIRLSDGEIPWLEVARKRDLPGEYFGPFTSGMIRKTIMDIITRNFRILGKRPTAQLKKLINKAEYGKRAGMARKILKGDVDTLISELEKEMKEYSSKENFEYAITLRNQANALKTLKERQVMESSKSVDANVVNYSISGEEVFLLVFNVRKGIMEDKQEFVFPESEGHLAEFLARFYETSQIPDEIILPEGIGRGFGEFLSKKSGKKVNVICPKSGEKKELLEFAKRNVTATFFAGNERISELQSAIGLAKPPRIIECFDISHLSGTNTVASMVCFSDGFPDKANYRRFRIRADTGSDDLAAMEEVVRRRYTRVLDEKMRKPDLIVIDGGPTQLGAAARVLKELEVGVPVISLAKQFEEIYALNREGPIRLERKNKGLQMLQAIRDEAHRFAITYQRLLRKKDIYGSKLNYSGPR